MAPPSDVEAQSEVFEATGRKRGSGLLVDESFRIGPFAVVEVDRAATSGTASSSSLGLGGLALYAAANEELQGGHSFRFAEGGEDLHASCRTFTSRKGSSFGRLDVRESTSRLVCSCGSGDDSSGLELVSSGERPSGSVSLAGGTLEVTSVKTSNAGWASAEPVGFRVDGAGGPVGAVEVLRPGRMWLSTALSPGERRKLACLLVGVMLSVDERPQLLERLERAGVSPMPISLALRDRDS
jgi:hypothetical protein